MKFEGIYTPIITPFSDDLSIDESAYAQVIEYQIQHGIHGLVIGGTTGESYAMTHAERVGQFAAAHDVIAGRLPWIAGINDMRTEDVCALAQAARDAGADGLLLGVPPYSLPSETALAHHAMTVARATDLPIMLYNYPGRSGVGMGTAFLEKVRASSTICAIKESSGDVARIHELTTEFPNLQMSCGADDLALEFFAWGARSWVCAAANIVPDETRALYETCAVESDFNRGRDIMSSLLPLMAVLEQSGEAIPCVKFATSLEGLSSNAVRPPLTPLEGKLKETMQDAVASTKHSIKDMNADLGSDSKLAS